MKIKTLTYLMAALIALPAFQSCKSDQAFAKRKYTKHHIKKDKRASIDKPEKLYFHEEFAEQTTVAKKADAEITAEVTKTVKIKKVENANVETTETKNIKSVEETEATPALTTSKVEKTIAVKELAKVEDVPTSVKSIESNSRYNAAGLSILEVIVSIILPPLAVGLFWGIDGVFLLNILLTLLFYLPGLIHALIVLNGN